MLNVQERGHGTTNPGVQEVDAVPGLDILYPRKADLAGLTEGQVVTVRVRVTRHPEDVTPVAGVKVWDGITNYPLTGNLPGDYWNYDGLTPGQPAGISMSLVTPDGSLDGGIYEGSWTVPADFDRRGLLMAEIRLLPQATSLTTGANNVPLGPWTERNWAFVTEGSEPLTPIAPTVKIHQSGQGLQITFASMTGMSYQLEYSTDLQNWQSYGTPISGNGSTVVLGDADLPVQNSTYFVRIAVTAE